MGPAARHTVCPFAPALVGVEPFFCVESVELRNRCLRYGEDSRQRRSIACAVDVASCEVKPRQAGPTEIRDLTPGEPIVFPSRFLETRSVH